MKRFPLLVKIAALLALISLAACAAPTALPTTVATPSAAAPTVRPAASPTSSPSPTAAASRLLILADLARQPELKEAADLVSGELARDARLNASVVTTIKPADLADVRLAVLLSPAANLDELVSAAPQVTFLAVLPEFPGTKPNVSVIRTPPEQLAFLAGFISTIISPDWRSAGLLPTQPATLVEAFQNGGRYFCGRCTPFYAPIVAFPLAAALAAGSPTSAWQAEVDKLQKNLLDTVYMSNEASSAELFKSLNAQRVILVGASSPDPSLKLRWAATVRFDLISQLRALWPNLLSGKNLRSATAGLTFGDVDETLLTPGKQRLVKQVIAGLLDTTIAPLSVK